MTKKDTISQEWFLFLICGYGYTNITKFNFKIFMKQEEEE